MPDPADHTIPVIAGHATADATGQESEKPQKKSPPGILASGLWLILFIIAVDCIGMLMAMVLPAIQAARETIRREQCLSKMKGLGLLGIQDFHDKNNHFPSYDDPDNPARPLCSWRVQLLPYIEEKQIFKRYDRTQSWNSSTNIALENILETSPYRCISNPSRSDTKSDVLTIVGPNCVFREKGSTKIADVTDGTHDTIMFVESANTGIHWMEPRDLKLENARIVEDDSTDSGIRSHHPGVVIVGFCDGSMKSISKDIDPKLLKALMTIDGGESVKGFRDQ